MHQSPTLISKTVQRLMSLGQFLIRAWLILLVSTSATAETLTLGTFPIPLMVESAERGLFIDMVREIERRTPYQFVVKVFPTKRAANSFATGRVDALLPALDVLLSVPYHRTHAFYFKKDYAFTRVGYPIPHQPIDLKALTVGFTQGYPYAPEVVAAANRISMAASDVANMRKLALGRVDTVIAERDSGLQALRDSGVKQIIYDEQSALSQLSVFIAMQASAQGCAQAQIISAAIDDMRLDGSLAEIFNLSDQAIEATAMAVKIDRSSARCELQEPPRELQ